MRISISKNSATLFVSARDTYQWAHKPGASWPCSTLSGRRFAVTFDRNGLVDLTVDGKYDVDDVDGHELAAICADLLATKLPATHPAYDFAVSQPNHR